MSGLVARMLPPDHRRFQWAKETDEAGYTVASAPEEPGTLVDVTVDAEPWPIVTTEIATASIDNVPATVVRLPRLEPAHVRVVDKNGIGVQSYAGLLCPHRQKITESETGEHGFLVADGQAYDVFAMGTFIGNLGKRGDVREWVPSRTDRRLTAVLRDRPDVPAAVEHVGIAGRVVDGRGHPLSGVLVTPLRSTETEDLFGFRYKRYSDDEDVQPPLKDSTISDTAGRFRLRTAYEGGYLRLAKPGYGPIAVPNATADGSDTALPRSARLRIHVVMPGPWNANHWRLDVARDGGRHGWTTLVPRPRGGNRFELVPLGEEAYRAYPLIAADAEGEIGDIGPGVVTVRLRTVGWSIVKDAELPEVDVGVAEFTIAE